MPYLKRSSSSIRTSGFLNEKAIIERFKKADFTLVDPGSMSIQEQIDMFSDAEIIAAPGGAALTNAIFAPADCTIVSLSASDMLFETFSSLASAIGQRYVSCIGRSYPRHYPSWLWTTFDFEINRRSVDRCLELII